MAIDLTLSQTAQPIVSMQNQNYSIKLTLLDEPGSLEWNTFIDISTQYITTHWPSVLENKSLNEFIQEYDSELRERLTQGNRELFLINNIAPSSQIVGIANTYTENETLYIAEFFILPAFRRQSYGTASLLQIIRMQNKDIKYFKAEVDKDQELANRFWSGTKLFQLDDRGDRNIYYCKLKDI